jgi:sugar phosphate isomerase/epimerase
MTILSRRDFGRALVAGVPLAAVIGSARLSAAQATIGVRTSSFRDLPRVTGRDNVDEVIRALQAVRATHVELALSNVEPAPPSTAPVMGGSAAYPKRILLSPEEMAATNAVARDALRTWRAETGPAFFEEVRRRFAAAGLTVDSCSVAFNDSFAGDEIDATLRQVKALGASRISSPLTIADAKRLAPFAERHQVSIAIHNQVDGNRAGAIDSANLGQALALSPAFSLALDIGNLTASNCDAVAVLREHRSRVSSVVVKDRLRNGGASQPFGEGDTPIKPVLELIAASPSIPAMVEYDYVGLRSPVEEVRASLAYLARS